MSKAASRLQAIFHFLTKVVPVVLGLAGLAFAIAWISGFFVEKIEPGELTTSSRLVGDRPTDEVHEVVKDYIEETVAD